MKDKEDILEKYYRTLIALAYRMLGTFSEAEDIAQEVAIEWHRTDKKLINNPKSWLIKVCTNKSIDHLRKAYKKRELYTGNWLPEILPDSLMYWETDFLDKKETMRTSFLLLLEKLTPNERAVYLLRIVFEYSFQEVSELTSLESANCRKIFQRASEKLNNDKLNKKKTVAQNDIGIIEKFFELACLGDKESLKNLLSQESVLKTDGGGKVSAARKDIFSSESVARFFATIFKSLNNIKYDFISVNGELGLIISRQLPTKLWTVETIFSFQVIDGLITNIYAQRNPDKLNFTQTFLKGK